VPAVPANWTLFLDGDADRPLRTLAEEAGIAIAPQRGADLGERLAAAFRDLRAKGARRVLAIGSDAPTVDPERILEAVDALSVCDVALEPTEDGGYYLIGMSGDHDSDLRGDPVGKRRRCRGHARAGARAGLRAPAHATRLGRLVRPEEDAWVVEVVPRLERRTSKPRSRARSSVAAAAAPLPHGISSKIESWSPLIPIR